MRILNYLMFAIILVTFTFCGGSSDKDLFEEANGLITDKKYDEALVIFEEIIEGNKESDFTPKALFECAKLYQGQVLKSVGPQESLKKSVEVYKNIFENYPNYEEAGNSLFMAGFILANELKNFDAAKQTYELYLEKYPTGDLADDAKVELENLGKTPEEILMEKLQNESSDEKAI